MRVLRDICVSSVKVSGERQRSSFVDVEDVFPHVRRLVSLAEARECSQSAPASVQLAYAMLRFVWDIGRQKTFPFLSNFFRLKNP
jgi:hypothetical protein